jgi:hypothetical protein
MSNITYAPVQQALEHLKSNRLDPTIVILAKAGIQTACVPWSTNMHWIPAFAGMSAPASSLSRFKWEAKKSMRCASHWQAYRLSAIKPRRKHHECDS